ncbi:hypothetical protein TRIATDRAFT_86968 [Trichoderma atroviride IMI 206040]|uniref:Uncharacterized protein n=1 Tax=Hypocrea atroviridis (strain ATCC 20476 / IMI 206040) TaxID=452589 RepID=G9NZH2_HYPAI|nr:uncharacterized protein TRIATDRAFT_86968 [Trichoderma atroviride IMI 206040]EHK44601.1 hypothetical protein TRIATDRAFT_86968 [Trichoderma atroviride IMI 206040]
MSLRTWSIAARFVIPAAHHGSEATIEMFAWRPALDWRWEPQLLLRRRTRVSPLRWRSAAIISGSMPPSSLFFYRCSSSCPTCAEKPSSAMDEDAPLRVLHAYVGQHGHKDSIVNEATISPSPPALLHRASLAPIQSTILTMVTGSGYQDKPAFRALLCPHVQPISRTVVLYHDLLRACMYGLPTRRPGDILMQRRSTATATCTQGAKLEVDGECLALIQPCINNSSQQVDCSLDLANGMLDPMLSQYGSETAHIRFDNDATIRYKWHSCIVMQYDEIGGFHSNTKLSRVQSS